MYVYMYMHALILHTQIHICALTSTWHMCCPCNKTSIFATPKDSNTMEQGHPGFSMEWDELHPDTGDGGMPSHPMGT